MKKTLLLLALAGITTNVLADEYVRGYVRGNGTYVAPYYRSTPDSSYNNNWSVQGNVNPYTGSYGAHSPTYNDRTPSYNMQNYGTPGYVTTPSYTNPYSNSRRSCYGLYCN